MTVARHQADHPMTVAEFLAYDDGTPTRYERVDGAMVAMNPPHFAHAQIVQNVGYWSATGVAAGDEGHTWREPDVVVTCVRPEGPYVRSPRVIVEVLSPSTEKEDRTTKLDFYETLPSLDAVLFVWQDDRRVRLRVREGNGWVDLDLIGSGTVRIDALGVDLTLDEIHADHWEPAA